MIIIFIAINNNSIQFAERAEPIVPVLKSDGKADEDLWGFQAYGESSLEIKSVSIPKIEDLFAQIGEGKARYEPGIPADPARRRVAEVCRDQYPTRVVLVKAFTVWCCFRPWHLSASDGEPPQGNPRSDCVPG